MPHRRLARLARAYRLGLRTLRVLVQLLASAEGARRLGGVGLEACPRLPTLRLGLQELPLERALPRCRVLEELLRLLQRLLQSIGAPGAQ